MTRQLPVMAVQGTVSTAFTGKSPKWKAGHRIELISRTLKDGTIKVHGSWIKRGKREKGRSRYVGHIPAKNLVNYLDKKRIKNVLSTKTKTKKTKKD